jgi:UDP-N-acetylmuramate--alanine ligase
MKSVGENRGQLHFVGVCGVGMAGLAYLLAMRGWTVSGCDEKMNPLADWLRTGGVNVDQGHAKAHVTPDLSCLVVTPAVHPDEPELLAAKASGIPIRRRGEVLAELMSRNQTVAVCGTHGKTTTSCFTTRLLQCCGMNPGWCIGGMTQSLGAVAGVGDGQMLIAESDESDGTLAFYHPSVTVLMNLDIDHLEHFEDEADLADCFRRVIMQTRRGVAVCADHARAFDLAKASSLVPILTFGFSESADVRATGVEVTKEGSSFDIVINRTFMGRVTLPVSGEHNIINALGAVVAALLLGLPAEKILKSLPLACSELPGRRFECIAERDGVLFVTDYAHHPQELRAMLTMARLHRPKRLIAVFQPHRYTRTLALGSEFPAAFAGADEVILLPVYAASEDPLPGGSTCDLYAHFRQQFPAQSVKLGRSFREVWHYLKTVVRPGDLVLIAGAGDVIQLAETVKNSFKACQTLAPFPGGTVEDAMIEPLGDLSHWTTYGVGGPAQWRVEVTSEASTVSLLRSCATEAIPLRFFGVGANGWISDLGMEGCAVRFAKGAFMEYDVQVDGTLLVGCGWRGSALLERLTADGWSGLEFLEGVPGSLGGWLAMNAGAHGGEIASWIKGVRLLESDGTVRTLGQKEMGFAYRHCAALQRRIALTCTLQLIRMESETIKAKRWAIREKRLPLAGLRTAGSVFKNPPGDSAGRLLDQAGCKGLRIGGATVTDFHANIIAVDDNATASDILALLQIMQNRVQAATGILLEPEVQGVTGSA